MSGTLPSVKAETFIPSTSTNRAPEDTGVSAPLIQSNGETRFAKFKRENPKAFKALVITGIILLVLAAVATTLVLLNHYKVLTWEQMLDGLKKAGSWIAHTDVTAKVWEIALASGVGIAGGVGIGVLAHKISRNKSIGEKIDALLAEESKEDSNASSSQPRRTEPESESESEHM